MEDRDELRGTETLRRSARLPLRRRRMGGVTLPARAVRDLQGVSNAAPVLFDLFSLLPGGEWFDLPYDETLPWRSAGTAGIKPRPTASKRTPYTCRCPAITRGFAPTISSCIYRRTDGTGSIVPAVCRPDDQPPVVRASSAREYYYRNYHIDYIPLPPVKPGCGRRWNRQIELIYPEHNAILTSERLLRRKSEKFIFKGRPRPP